MALSYLLRQGWKDALAGAAVIGFLMLVLKVGGAV